MMKAMATGPDGPLVVIGLSDGNEERLRKDEPIVFPLSDVRIMDGQTVVISYRHDGKNAVPAPPPDEMILFSVDDGALKKMRDSFMEISGHGIKFVFFRGQDEQSMRNQMREFIGPKTQVINTFPPSDKPPSEN